MHKKTKNLVQAALIAALYLALSLLQNALLYGSASWAIQLRVAEALCVLAFFTPAAIPGLAVGCMLFNLSMASSLPLDVPVGTAATALAAWGMYALRRVTVKGYPLPGLLMPAVCNGLLVGWELWLCMGGGFWVNVLYVAAEEVAVLLILGSPLYYALKSKGLAKYLET